MKRKPKTASKPPLNFNDPTLDETEMLPRSTGGWALSEENYPSLARFRFPGIEAPPAETPPAIPARAATREREAGTVKRKPKPDHAARKAAKFRTDFLAAAHRGVQNQMDFIQHEEDRVFRARQDYRDALHWLREQKGHDAATCDDRVCRAERVLANVAKAEAGEVTLDAKTAARLRRKARRVVKPRYGTEGDGLAYADALASDLLRVLDGKPGRKP